MSERPPGPGSLTISSVVDNGDVRLLLHGELDLASAPQMEERLKSAEQGPPARLIVDLADLAFIDSTGLRLLLQADARAREHGYELLIGPGDDSVQRVFEVTGALDVLRFEG